MNTELKITVIETVLTVFTGSILPVIPRAEALGLKSLLKRAAYDGSPLNAAKYAEIKARLGERRFSFYSDFVSSFVLLTPYKAIEFEIKGIFSARYPYNEKD